MRPDQTHFEGVDLRAEACILPRSSEDIMIISGSITQGDDIILADFEDDTIRALGGNDTVNGGGGNDFLEGNVGADALYGSFGLDSIDGSFGNDILYGGDGIDFLTGGVGRDVLHGGDQRDLLEGGSGNDQLFGGKGDDHLRPDESKGNDLVKGGRGFDTVSYDFISGAIRVDLSDHHWQDLGAAGIDRLISIENLSAGLGDDTLIGNDSANSLEGSGGNNLLSGQGGNDTLQGSGADNNTIDGGLGQDSLIGRPATDLFVFSSAAAADGDGVENFDGIARGSGTDKLSFKAIDADTKTGGHQTFVFIESSPFHHVAGELRIETIRAVTLSVQGDTDGDGSADFTVNMVKHFGFLTAEDFILQ